MSAPIEPIVQEIPYLDSAIVADKLALAPNFVWLDSANQQHPGALNRYSFMALDPWFNLRWKYGQGGDPIGQLSNLLRPYQCKTVPNIPPCQGGLIGYFAYDLCHYLDQIPLPQIDDMQFPDVVCGFYDLVISFDHQQQCSWIVSTGFPAVDEASREQRAQDRLRWLLTLIESAPAVKLSSDIPAFSVSSNFNAEGYRNMVQQTKDYICAGDIFEANVSQRFKAATPDSVHPYQIYSKLRNCNAAPFAAYLNFNDTVIASASPERFLKLSDAVVESRPIKGTRPRGKTVAEDEALADELIHSEKDRAENIMIVDLMRNDLSKICSDDSVIVPQLCTLESFVNVHHLVSVVQGKLKPELKALDLIRATFPGGSITGAPKIRVMEIIAELEPNRRGPYTGSIGCIGFDGSMDLSITIRTFAMRNQQITFQAGGAIVYDSDPHEEYAETLDKARALFKTLNASEAAVA